MCRPAIDGDPNDRVRVAAALDEFGDRDGCVLRDRRSVGAVCYSAAAESAAAVGAG